MIIYAIKDILSNDFGSMIYTFPNDDVAKRWFGQVVSSSVLPKDRGDLELWRLGFFDCIKGEIILHKDKNNLLANIIERERIMIGSEVE